MKKSLGALFAAILILAMSAAGLCESLFVDNQETDKIYPERLNLRAEPTRNGAILRARLPRLLQRSGQP